MQIKESEETLKKTTKYLCVKENVGNVKECKSSGGKVSSLLVML
jgi:hypothetical protein